MRRLTAVLVISALAGCEAGTPDNQAIIAEGDKLTQPLPGLYRSTTTFSGYELPNADADDARIVRERMAGLGPQVREFCITPAKAKRGFRDMLSAMQDGDCTIERFTSHGGTLDATMRCAMTGGGTSSVAMTGRADPQSSHVKLEIEQLSNSIPGGKAKLTLEIANQRTGDCASGTAAG